MVTPPLGPVTAAGLIVVYAGMSIMALGLLGVWATPLWGAAVFGAGMAVVASAAAWRKSSTGL